MSATRRRILPAARIDNPDPADAGLEVVVDLFLHLVGRVGGLTTSMARSGTMSQTATSGTRR